MDRIILAAARGQHYVVTRDQLRAAGLSDNDVDGRVRRGLLERRYRGVYQVGPVPSPLSHFLAACLACGATAALCRCSAGELWKIMCAVPDAPVDVVITGGSRQHPGIRVHRVRVLPSSDVTVQQGIRVTTPMRTLLDLAAILPMREVERALSEALVLRLVGEAGLRRFLTAHAGMRGANALSAQLERDPAFTRSEAEVRFLELVRSSGLPAPRVNARACGLEVDFWWQAERLVVEVDGLRYHDTRIARERDRQRDSKLAAAGIRVMRVSWHRLRRESNRLLVELAQALWVLR